MLFELSIPFYNTSQGQGIESLKGFPLLFAFRHKRLGILFTKQSVKLFSQTFSIQCHSPVLRNHPERMVSRVDPFSPHRMGKLVGGLQTDFQFTDSLIKRFFLCFQLNKLCDGILPLRMRGAFEMWAILPPKT